MTIKVGERFINNLGDEAEVISYKNAKNITVRFIATKHERIVMANNLRSGSFKDKLQRSVFGVGITGDGISKINGRVVKSYETWRSMLRRCYSDKYQIVSPSYKGCSVHSDWHFYSNFKRWFDKNYIDNYHLDKDLLIKNNKQYSADACAFIPASINILITDNSSQRGELPRGVCVHEGGYQAKFSAKGKTRYLGLFDSPELAHRVYVAYKRHHVRQIAEEYFEAGLIKSEIYSALLNWKVNG
jgi:hypothetical protein